MALIRSHAFRRLSRVLVPVSPADYPPLIRSCSFVQDHNTLGFCQRYIWSSTTVIKSTADQCSSSYNCSSDKVTGSPVLYRYARFMATQAAKVAPQQLKQGALRVTMLSPGIVYEPYKPRQPIPFWRRWFTLTGWRRTKEDVIMEMKNAYAIARLRKVSGYSKKVFYQEAVKLYKEINMNLANGDKASLRKLVTENMFSAFKNEIKRRETLWSSVHWEMIEPVVSIRTLRARLIGIDKNDLDKAFIQLTLEFLSKQKFEAYNSNGDVISGDKTNEVLVRDIWVFEKSMFHPGSYWRLCARLPQ